MLTLTLTLGLGSPTRGHLQNRNARTVRTGHWHVRHHQHMCGTTAMWAVRVYRNQCIYGII